MQTNQETTRTITRDGENFTLTHQACSEPETTSLANVFEAAHRCDRELDNVYWATSFLARLLAGRADSGKSMDEADIRGLSVLLDSMAGGICELSTAWHTETTVIEELVAGNV